MTTERNAVRPANNNAICDRLQMMHISTSPEPRFYHYCFVCNTQLNSCKQALLHCNGKRHKKKQAFLQRRNFGSMPGPSPQQGAIAPPLSPGQYLENAGNQVFYSNSNPMTPFPGYTPTGPPTLGPEGRFYTSQTIAPPNNGMIYPILIGTSLENYHMSKEYPGSFSLCQQISNLGYTSPPPNGMPPFFNPPLPPHGQSACSSPLFLTELSYSSVEPASSHSNRTASRSTIISPTSSISSGSDGKPKCDLCSATFPNPTQLFAHLRAAKHFRPIPVKKMDKVPAPASNLEEGRVLCDNSNKPDTRNVSCCSNCNMTTADQAVTSERPRSSSSESAQEGPSDSGYLSGASVSASGESQLHCQLCDVSLNSQAQANEHLSSSRHLSRESKKQPSIRRKVIDRPKKKAASPPPFEAQRNETS